MTAFVVAIDGPAASGKSTTARLAAERLGFLYLDTGAMYRAVARTALDRGVDLADETALGALAAGIRLELERAETEVRYRVDGRDVTAAIRAPEVSDAASAVARVSSVRRAMVRLQRQAAREGGIVVEGRDIGTVVFPEAAVKVFLVASLQERARRRQLELAERGVAVEAERLREEIRARDEQDSQRADSPLRRAPDAIPLDTTGLSVAEQVDRVVDLVREAQGAGERG